MSIRIRFGFLAACCTVAAALGAEPADEDRTVADRWTKMEAERAEVIRLLESRVKTHPQMLRNAELGLVRRQSQSVQKLPSGRFAYGSIAAKKKFVEEMGKEQVEFEEMLGKLQDREVFAWPNLPARMSVGDFGLPRDGMVGIRQVVDESNVLAHLPEHSDRWFWIERIDTENMVDERLYRCDIPLEVVRTKTYETVAGGTKTVLVLAPIDREPYEKLNREFKERDARAAATPPARPAPKPEPVTLDPLTGQPSR